MSSKTRTLAVNINALLEIDYSPDDLEAMGKTFREFKLGVERVIKAELLPAFQADPHSRITLTTIAYPSSKKLDKMRGGGHLIVEKKQ